ncbi:MAG TPA: hotdog fold thioesterase [Candidatus Hydrogenedentes bacterium]|nr:hotdog fold thioesterase [Candidatus Hydrogenedentota bacterium]
MDMDHVREYFKKDRLAAYLGIEIVDVSPGFATVRMPVQDFHLNAVDVVHGGAIFSLADYAFAVSSNSHGTVALAIQASIYYLKAGRGGVLTATSREVTRNPKLATYHIEVKDDQGNLIASFEGMVYRKQDPITA